MDIISSTSILEYFLDEKITKIDFESDLSSFNKSKGIYAAWYNKKIIYIGQSANLCTRIKKHYSGQRGSNQFCTYIFDIYLICDICNEKQHKTSELNKRTQTFIQENITFSIFKIEADINIVSLETELRKMNHELSELINKI